MAKKGQKHNIHECYDSDETIAICVNCKRTTCETGECELFGHKRTITDKRMEVMRAFKTYKLRHNSEHRLMVEKVVEHYLMEKDKRKMIDMYFMEQRTSAETRIAVGISKTTFFNWKKEILELSYKWLEELQGE